MCIARASQAWLSPERRAFTDEVDMVVVPGSEGNFGVLAGHSPFISTIRPGVIDIFEGDRIIDRIFIAGGFADATMSSFNHPGFGAVGGAGSHGIATRLRGAQPHIDMPNAPTAPAAPAKRTTWMPKITGI